MYLYSAAVLFSKGILLYYQECIRTSNKSNFNRSPVRSKLLQHTENRTTGHMLSNNHLCLRSTGGKFQPVLKLHTLTLAAHFYVLLYYTLIVHYGILIFKTAPSHF